MEIIILTYIFLIGLIMGSFYNVVGLRLPKKISFTSSRSQCPNCSTPLNARDLIPLFSYLLSKGKCRHCQTTISISYPLVELLTGGLFLFSYWMYGWTPAFLGACLLSSLAVMVTVSDLNYMLIPNKLLIFFAIIFIIYRSITPLDPWYASVIGALAAYALVACIIIVSKGGMGAGDMKLLAVLGILLGTKHIFLTFFFATLLGTVISLLLIMLKVIGRKDPFPFGPSIMIAALLVYFFGEEIIRYYLQSFY
ncbi:prepilin peptidase [Halobacillus yeomjeoni]|uniref:Prepilin peptidase n=1 Tax=Halobacillus yeomjeoni TaxID=311194 RepID=A0A931MUY5_9BACI|nr:A24 family peptidase [Halobacillus yeomjeoni]MBH0230025.1 prepilin peptidase [Halobacillus yeomjeoni]